MTGYNEAFIIDGKKKDELIAEDPKSAEIIRPILRGRDIKRYGYEFADLYLINSHNGVKERDIKPVDINDYHAIKRWLDFGGVTYNGKIYEGYKQIEKRADQGNTPYNLRNCAYMEDFSKQKIVWKRVGSILRFSYDESHALALDSTCFATGQNIKYLVAILNSKFGKYLMKDSPKTGTGDLLISVQAIEPLLIPIPEKEISFLLEKTIDEILIAINNQKPISEYEDKIDLIVYDMLGFTDQEIEFIELQ